MTSRHDLDSSYFIDVSAPPAPLDFFSASSYCSMSDMKNIVIIGGEFSPVRGNQAKGEGNNAGHAVANTLVDGLPGDYRVIVVERNTYVCWAPGTVRQLVVPGWEDKNFQLEVTQERFFPEDSRHRVLCPNTVKELKRSSVVLEHPFEGSTELPFWVRNAPLTTS